MTSQDASNTAIDALPPLSAMVRALDMRARKSLGQNFLFDLNLTRRIARSAGTLNGTSIEVGPGPGGLTRALLLEGAEQVIAIEKDFRARSVLDSLLIAANGRLQLVEGDALKTPLWEMGNAPRRIIANLPYNIATSLLIQWLEHAPAFESLTLMFQREVAERIVAKPGSKAYGRLALLAQWRADARIVLNLPPEAFTPPPKVSSAVVHLTALPEPRFLADPDVLNRVVAAAFNQRRKMLRSALKGTAPDIEDRLLAAGLKPTERAEQVPLEGFCALAREIAKG